MAFKRLIFWQTVPSPHQVSYIQRLAASPAFEQVTLVAERPLGLERLSLGWDNVTVKGLDIVLSPDHAKVSGILACEPACTIHLLGGYRGLAFARRVLSERQRVGFGCGLISEGADIRGIIGKARKLVYMCEARRFRAHFDFILAMGENGTRWFRNAGWPTHKLFPFAYVTENPVDQPGATLINVPPRPFRLAYVGQLIPRKGVDFLLKALARLPGNLSWQLTVFGAGIMDSHLRQTAQELEIAARVSFRGAIPIKQVSEEMSQSDLVLLPSRFDGWGAVVNESLMCGTPVLCSDACGAKDLLGEPWRGEVLPVGSPGAWVEALGRWIKSGPVPASRRKQIRAWSQRIGGAATAAYFQQVLANVYDGLPRPTPPWVVEVDRERSAA